jgi:hypothetical protein
LRGTVPQTFPDSDHFDGTHFFNPTGPAAQPFSAVPRMLLERRTPWPARVDDPPRALAPLDGAVAVVTFIGHATFLIQTRQEHPDRSACTERASP